MVAHMDISEFRHGCYRRDGSSVSISNKLFESGTNCLQIQYNINGRDNKVTHTHLACQLQFSGPSRVLQNSLH